MRGASPRPLVCTMRRRTGFTLVEIMIVIAIVSILAALAIVSMLRSRMNANEMGAIASLRTISSGAQNFYAQASPHTYPSALTDLSTPVSNPPYIDSLLAGGVRQGYTFVYARTDADHYTCRGNPVTPGRTGTRYFYVDETGRITANMTGPAGPTDPFVE